MDDAAEFDRAIGLIYEVATAPERLPDILAHLTDWLQGDTCHLVGWAAGSAIPTISVSTGLSEGVGPDYAAYYAALDPRRQLALDHQSPGELLVCHEHFDKAYVSRSEFYQDYLLPIGVQYMLGTTLLNDSSALVQIAFQRHVGHAHFAEREILLAQRLIPHMQRALKLMLQFQQRQDQLICDQAGLEASSLGVLGLSARGEILYANAGAERLLQSAHGLRQAKGRLCATDADRNAELELALRRVAATGGAASLNLGGLHGHCCLSLTRLPPAADLGIASRRAEVLCLITESASRRVATAQQLIELFGLSPAEARLARALARGETLDDYALHEGVKRSTLKSHLQHAQLKMGVKSQKEMIRLVTMLPAVR